MFGVEFFVAFGIGMLISAGAMTFYHYMEYGIKRISQYSIIKANNLGSG
jgi:hypothetical protein